MMTRKRIIRQTCLVFLLSLQIASCGGSARTLGSPSPSAGANATVPTTNGSVFFVSDKVGWVVAIPPDRIEMAIFRTNDGGAHWQLWGISPAVGRPVGFSATEVVIFTGAGLVRSSDGADWRVESSPATQDVYSFGAPFFLPDLQEGWFGATAVSPGGSAARCQTLPPGKGGGVVCQTAFIWHTVDGGGSWQLLAKGNIDVSGATTFWNSNSGAISNDVEFAGQVPWGPSLELTHDGGVTWHKLLFALPGATAGALALIDAPTMFGDLNGVVAIKLRAGAPPFLYLSLTSDGGQTWSTPQSVKGPDDATCSICDYPLFFLDTRRWLAVGDGLFLTNDAGLNWRSITTTNPGSTTTGVEVIRSRPGTAFELARGVSVSVTSDWGVHWHTVGLPQVYPTYTGVAGMGGWPISI